MRIIWLVNIVEGQFELHNLFHYCQILKLLEFCINKLEQLYNCTIEWSVKYQLACCCEQCKIRYCIDRAFKFGWARIQENSFPLRVLIFTCILINFCRDSKIKFAKAFLNPDTNYSSIPSLGTFGSFDDIFRIQQIVYMHPLIRKIKELQIVNVMVAIPMARIP